jgi:DNA-binding response OmpR family regulator
MPKTTILIVEDDIASAEMLTEMFGMAGYYVEAVSTIDQAASAMKARRYAAALLDLSLPETTMSELCDQLQGLPTRPPIVIFSARLPADIQMAEKQLGAVAVLHKPARMELILATLARVVGREA